MHKKQIEQLICKYIQKRTSIKITKINTNDDLYTKQLLDSFDLINIIKEIENFYKIEINIEEINNFKFSINFITKLIHKKLNE